LEPHHLLGFTNAFSPGALVLGALLSALKLDNSH
jgi:hypothetical protein